MIFRVRTLAMSAWLLFVGIHCGNSTSAPTQAASTGPAPTGTSPPPTTPKNVYFYSDDTQCGVVFGVPSGGGTPAVAVPVTCDKSGRSPVSALAFDSSRIYLGTFAGRCGSYATGNSSYVDYFDAPDGSYLYVSAIAADTNAVYFVVSSLNTAEIRMTPVGGGAAQSLAKISGFVGGLAVDAKYLYWTEDLVEDADAGTRIGDVKRIPLAGGAAETIADSQATPSAIFVDDTGVYWLNRGNGSACGSAGLWQNGTLSHIVPGSTAVPVVLATDLTNATSIARGGGAVYWTAGSFDCNYLAYSGAVSRIKDGSATTDVLARDLGAPGNLFVDATSVYYTSVDAKGNVVATVVSR